MCKTLPREINENKKSFWARQERNSPFDTKGEELIAGDDLMKGIYERRFSNRVPTEYSAEPTSSAEQPQGLPAVIAELTRWAAKTWS